MTDPDTVASDDPFSALRGAGLDMKETEPAPVKKDEEDPFAELSAAGIAPVERQAAPDPFADLTASAPDLKPVPAIAKGAAPTFEKPSDAPVYDKMAKSGAGEDHILAYEVETGREASGAWRAFGERVKGIVWLGVNQSRREERKLSDLMDDQKVETVTTGVGSSPVSMPQTETRLVRLSERTPGEIVQAAHDAGIPSAKIADAVRAWDGTDTASLYATVRQLGADEIVKRGAVRERAAEAISRRGATAGGKMASLTAQNLPYMAEFMLAASAGPAGLMALVLKEGENAANAFAADRYEVAPDGEIFKLREGDDPQTAMLKGVARGAVTVGVESFAGGAAEKALGSAAGALVKKIGGEAATAKAGAIAALGPIKYFTRNMPGGTAKTVLRNTQNVLATRGLNKLPGEWFEELADPLVAGMLGLNEDQQGRSNYEQTMAGLKDFFTSEQQGDTLLTLVGLQAVGGLVGLPVAIGRHASGDKAERRSAMRSFLTTAAGIDEETAQRITDNDEAADAVLALSNLPPERAATVMAGLSDRAAKAVNDANQAFGMREEAKNFESDAAPLAEKAAGASGRLGANLSYEVDDGGVFVTLFDDSGRAIFNSDNLEEFNAKAGEASRILQARDARRTKKAETVQRMATDLGVEGRVHVAATAEEAARVLEQLGNPKEAATALANGDRFKAVTVSNRDTGESDVVLVLDNASSPADAARSVFHEMGVHVALARSVARQGVDAVLDSASVILGENAERAVRTAGARIVAAAEAEGPAARADMAARKLTPEQWAAERASALVSSEDKRDRMLTLEEGLSLFAEEGIADPDTPNRVARAIGRSIRRDQKIFANVQTLLAQNLREARGGVEFRGVGGNAYGPGFNVLPEEETAPSAPAPSGPAEAEQAKPAQEAQSAPATAEQPAAEAAPQAPEATDQERADMRTLVEAGFGKPDWDSMEDADVPVLAGRVRSEGLTAQKWREERAGTAKAEEAPSQEAAPVVEASAEVTATPEAPAQAEAARPAPKPSRARAVSAAHRAFDAKQPVSDEVVRQYGLKVPDTYALTDGQWAYTPTDAKAAEAAFAPKAEESAENFTAAPSEPAQGVNAAQEAAKTPAGGTRGGGEETAGVPELLPNEYWQGPKGGKIARPPFKPGDRVKVANSYGSVLSMGKRFAIASPQGEGYVATYVVAFDKGDWAGSELPMDANYMVIVNAEEKEAQNAVPLDVAKTLDARQQAGDGEAVGKGDAEGGEAARAGETPPGAVEQPNRADGAEAVKPHAQKSPSVVREEWAAGHGASDFSIFGKSDHPEAKKALETKMSERADIRAGKLYADNIRAWHLSHIGEAVGRQQPINADAVSEYKMAVPKDYVREGGLYVYKPARPSFEIEGAEFAGVQQLPGVPDQHIWRDGQTGATVIVPADAERAEVERRLAEVRQPPEQPRRKKRAAKKEKAAPDSEVKPSGESPLQREWGELKRRNPTGVLAVRLGDFYEFFNEDAETAKTALDLKLTQRNDVKMAGIPYHAFDAYAAKLTQAGHDVHVVDYDATARQRYVKETIPSRSVSSEKAVAEAKAPEPSVSTEVARAESETATPTEAQKEAGNYRKGRFAVHGMEIAIENPVGSVRSGVSKEGKPWRTEMRNSYGYFAGEADGKDGDKLDVFLGPDVERAESVYVIDQVDPATGAFDEHKVMLGFPSEEAARAAYESNYQKGWKGLKSITGVSVGEFKAWMGASDRKMKPFADYAAVKAVTAEPEATVPEEAMPAADRKGRTFKELQAMRRTAKQAKESAAEPKPAEAKAPERPVGARIEVETAPDGDKTVSVPSKDNPDISPKAQKRYLLAEIDKAIETAPSDRYETEREDDYNALAKRLGLPRSEFWQKRDTLKKGAESHVLIQVPGDGEFRIVNTLENLWRFKEAVEKRFPEKKMPKSMPHYSRARPELSGEADWAIQHYGDAAKAADKVEAGAAQEGVEPDEAKRYLELARELRERAELTSDPKMQTTDMLEKARAAKRKAEDEALNAKIQENLAETRRKAIEAMKRDAAYPELRKLLESNYARLGKYNADGSVSLPEDGDLLNATASGAGAPAIRQLQDQIAKRIGVPERIKNTERNRRRFLTRQGEMPGTFPLSRYYGDMATDFTPEAEPEAQPEGGSVRFRITPEQDADYLAAVERGDMEAAQRMVDEAAKRAGYNVGPVWHGSKSKPFNVFDSEQGQGQFYFTNRENIADEYVFDPDGPYVPSSSELYKEHVRRFFVKINNPAVEDRKGEAWFGAGNTYKPKPGWDRIYDKGMIWHDDQIQEAFDDDFYRKNKKFPSVAVSISDDPVKAEKEMAEEFERFKNERFDNTTKASDTKKTRDASEGYRTQGHDGVIFKDIVDSVWSRSASDVYVAFNPEQIKSADPVTRDDQGNVIPLSQRFNPETPDIRFRIDQTQTPEFKRWFGDSKVTDSDGEPLVVYHGSPVGGIANFNDSEDGIAFTSKRKVAEGYTWNRGIWRKPSKTGTVYQAFLSLNNPLIIDAYGKRNDNIPVPWQDWKPKVYGNLPNNAVNLSKVAEYAKANGHDGFIVRNVIDTADIEDRTSSDVYVVFSSSQVKLDIAGKDIRFRISPRLEALGEMYVKPAAKLAEESVSPGADWRRYLAEEEGAFYPNKAAREVFADIFGPSVSEPMPSAMSREDRHAWEKSEYENNPGAVDELVRRVLAARKSGARDLGLTPGQKALLNYAEVDAARQAYEAALRFEADPSDINKAEYDTAMSRKAEVSDANEYANSLAGEALGMAAMGRSTPDDELAYRIREVQNSKIRIKGTTRDAKVPFSPAEMVALKRQIDELFARNAELDRRLAEERAAADKARREIDAAAGRKAKEMWDTARGIPRDVTARPSPRGAVLFRIDTETRERLRGVWMRADASFPVDAAPTVGDTMREFSGMALEEGYEPADIGAYLSGVAETLRRRAAEEQRDARRGTAGADRALLPPSVPADTPLTRAVRAAVLQASRELPAGASYEEGTARGIEILNEEGVYTGLTPSEFQREWAGVGKTRADNRDEAEKREWNWRQAARYAERIADLAKGIAPVKAQTRQAMTLETRKLAALFRREFAEAVRERRLPDSAIEEAMVTAVGAVRRWLENQIEALEDAIGRGEAMPEPGRALKDDDRTLALRERVRELRAMYDKLPAVEARRRARELTAAKSAETRKQNAIEQKRADLAAGLLPSRQAAPLGIEPDEELAAERAETARLREAYKAELRANPEMQERMLNETLDGLQASLDAIEADIEAGVGTGPSEGKPLPDARVLKLREAIRKGKVRMRQIWDDAHPAETLARKEEAKATRLKRSIAELRRRMALGLYSPKVRAPDVVTPLTLRLEAEKREVRRAYDEEARQFNMRRRRLAVAGFDIPVGRLLVADDVLDKFFKSAGAMLDVSGAFVQNAPLSAALLPSLPEHLHRSISAAISDPAYLAFIEAKKASPLYDEFVANGGAGDVGPEELTGGQSAHDMGVRLSRSRFLPLRAYGKAMTASSRVMSALNLDLRLHAYKILRESYPDATEGEKRAFAHTVNVLGGYGDTKWEGAFEPLLTRFMWSNRNFSAQVMRSIGFGGILGTAGLKSEDLGPRRHWYESTPGALKLHFRAVAGALALKSSVAALAYLLRELNGGDDEPYYSGSWDDEDTFMAKLSAWFFGPVAFGDSSIDFNGRAWRIWQVIGKLWRDFTGPRPAHDVFGDIGQFVRQRVGPWHGMQIELAEIVAKGVSGKGQAKNAIGEPASIGDFIPAPMSVTQAYEATADAFQQYGVWGLLAAPVVLGATATGALSSTYPSQYPGLQSAHDARMAKWRAAKKSGDAAEEARLERRHMLEIDAHPELSALEKQMRAGRAAGDDRMVRKAAAEWRRIYEAARDRDAERNR